MEADDPTLEGGIIARQPGEPTAKEIERLAREVREQGFYSQEGPKLIWNRAWSDVTYRIRKQHIPGETWRKADEADFDEPVVPRHSMRAFYEAVEDRRIAKEWN